MKSAKRCDHNTSDFFFVCWSPIGDFNRNFRRQIYFHSPWRPKWSQLRELIIDGNAVRIERRITLSSDIQTGSSCCFVISSLTREYQLSMEPAGITAEDTITCPVRPYYVRLSHLVRHVQLDSATPKEQNT